MKWTIEHGTSDQYHIHDENGNLVASTADRMAVTHSAAKNDEQDYIQANLIAAAPDLLEAIIYYTENYTGAEPSVSLCDLKFAKAVAKATGRSL